MKYYSLQYEYPMSANNDYYDINDGIEFDGVDSWTMGKAFDQPPPTPIIVPMEATGDWPEAVPPPMKIGHMLLMSEPMVKALEAIPVSNLDVYPAILRDTQNGKEFNYFAVNILGMVSAADPQASVGENLDGEMKMDSFYQELVLDPARAGNQDIFRLMEDGSIIVSERAKTALQHIPLLEFVPVTP